MPESSLAKKKMTEKGRETCLTFFYAFDKSFHRRTKILSTIFQFFFFFFFLTIFESIISRNIRFDAIHKFMGGKC